MKKRDLKGFMKDMSKFTMGSLGAKQKRVIEGNSGKINLSYKMYQGMRGKSLERADERKQNERMAGIVGGSGRDQKLMQNHFERDH